MNMPSLMMVGGETPATINNGYSASQENQTSEMGNAVYEALVFLLDQGFLGYPPDN